MSTSLKKYLLPISSFLLPLFLLVLLWIALQLAPFGDNNLLVSDLGTQYLPFLNSFKRFFEEGSYSLYSFSDALGGNILVFSAYYLISPFNFLVLFFPYNALPIAALLIITLKISSIGLSMFYYLNKTYKQTSVYTLLFSTSYSFCGFVTIYCLNFMWLDALILLPILVLAIQRLWNKKQYFLYITTLFLAIVTNYYMGYMLCIFAVFYSLYWYYLSSDRKHKNLKTFIIDGKLFFMSSLLTGLSTSFILLPAIEGMLATKKTDIDFSAFLPLPKFGLTFFSQLGIGSINFDLRLNHLPTIFSGIFITLLFIAFFTLPTITKKQKKYAAILLSAIFLSFWIELISTVWHMFQSPAGFPYRNSFIFSFLLVKFAYEAFLHLPKKHIFSKKIPLTFTLILFIGYLTLVLSPVKHLLLSSSYILLTFLFIWLIYSLFTLSRTKSGLFKQLITSLLFLCICFELGFNFWISLKDIPFGNQTEYAKTFNQQESIIEDVEQKQSDLVRIKQTIPSKITGFKEQNNGYNNSFLYGYAGVSSYSSTLSASTQDTLKNLGLYSKNDRRIAYVDESQVVNFILNIAYTVTPEKKESQKNISSDKATYVYSNSEAVGMGFLVPDTFAELSLKNEQPLINQENILQAISANQQPYFVDTTDWTIQKTAETTYTIQTTTSTKGELYFYIPTFKWDQVTSFKVNQQLIETPVYIAKNQLYNLGFFEANTPIELQIDTKENLTDKEMIIKTLNQKQFDTFITEQKEHSLQLEKQSNGTFQGDIEVTQQQNSLLFLSIPFDKNWKIELDGKTITPTKTLDNFIGLTIPKGKHQLVLSYQPKSFIIGSIISLVILLSWLFYQAFKRKFYKILWKG